MRAGNLLQLGTSLLVFRNCKWIEKLKTQSSLFFIQLTVHYK